MADKEIKDEGVKDESESTSGKKGSLVGWIITFSVAIICAGGGYGLSGLFAKVAPGKVDSAEEAKKSEFEAILADSPDSAKPWVFELSPITANLNEPGSTRMIQVTVVLELAAEMDKVRGEDFLKERVVHLRDWLGAYLAGLKLIQVSGSSNQSRMKVDIQESFNGKLFPDSKPLVQKIMLKDFMIQ
ncbi:MAG: flagellar basal body-associated FliL family protein [Phycisphaerae bacterium]|nr:flagellar basal body-associated FliL family protein [Phycisphaerae bacterium]